MRINVYAEEMTTETELVTKTVTDEEFGTRTFYGARLYLHSPDVLHHSADDDDRSAITFFVPWTKADGHDFDLVRVALNNLYQMIDQAERDLEAKHRVPEPDEAQILDV